MNYAPDYMGILKIDEQELKNRLAFFQLTERDFARLASLRGFAEKYMHEIIDALYELILGHGETKAFFPDEQTVQHVKKMQHAYFLGLFTAKCDLAYVEDRLKVGAIHESIGMPPKWYLGAYGRYLALIHERLAKEVKDAKELFESFGAVKRRIFFDMSFAIDTYIAAHMETMGRHQAAIRELSTPVIKVYDRVLLLPIVGTIDTQRAHQVMEAVLTKVVQEQALVIILDIAGVPVVDTKVADHLIKTTAAVRLLGAQTILTGISAMVARTVVQLGVDIGGMHTRTRLADGIELALDIVGKKIASKEPA